MKKLFVFISGLFAYVFLAFPVLAVTPAPVSVNPCKSSTDNNPISIMLCQLGGENVGNTLRNIVVFFVMVAVIFALIYLLYGGIKWITSKGEKAEVEAARNHIMAAVIGLIVVILAVFILSIVLGAFGIDWSQLIIPTINSGLNPTAK